MADPLEGVQEPLRSIAQQIVNESGGRIGISSGYRTHDQQAKLYDDYIHGRNNQAKAARPGHSHHETGRAVDFSGDMELLHKLAKKHGIIFPVAGEAWHGELGSGQSYEGEPTLNYDPAAGDPAQALDARLTAVQRILGGQTDIGTQSGSAWTSPTDVASFLSNEYGSGAAAGGQMGGDMMDMVRNSSPQHNTGDAGSYQKYALKQFQQYGWGEDQLNALITLWNKESKWDPSADNPHSTAAGIAQKLQSVNGPVEPTAEGQINWGLNYIKQRYGSPSAALQFHLRHNWY